LQYIQMIVLCFHEHQCKVGRDFNKI
jgi:hypothetical protein